jgi:gluconate 2-dehydrogenase gamma chain
MLTDAERSALKAVAERLFPETPSGPGAQAIGVVDAIVQQLATAWGDGEGAYLQGPWDEPADSGHGWQSCLTPREAYRYALAALDEHCRREHGAPFSALRAEAQDAVLERMEADDLDTFVEVSARECFELIYANVLEGLFADPVHGGNRGLLGWRWLGYPGPQPAYGVDYGTLIDSTEPYAPEPVALPRPAP